ncbi:hypothetical protein [Chryseobacterium sp. W4I1]|uniref:SGNH/GDSL hydrolase family protein n=1 Tax=Chryseobacterium sp. W4I1 TaxID=3042293 RepID=UPI0027832A9B|nr:hypothetical protein [Chryseobacterium sp. W4I1]MDQ0783948.1 hypothetical protein [Chryseobacterium sp. W4I1]
MSTIGKIIRVNALPPQGQRETNVIYQVAEPGSATYTDYAIDENGDMKTPAAANVSPLFNPNTNIEAQGGQQISEYVSKRVEIQDTVFINSSIESDAKQVTASGLVTTTAVSNVRGVSISIGVVPNTFNKIYVSFAQDSVTPITEIEVRLFQGKKVDGTLIAKKRQTVTASTTNDFTTTVQFDSNIQYSGELWIQILTNNPFSYKRVATATRTSALGYGAPFVTTINDLNATSFPNSQGYVDMYVEFNRIDGGIKLTDEGKSVVINPLTGDKKSINITGNYTALNNYLKSDGTMSNSQNWRTTEMMFLSPGNYEFYGKNTTISVGVVGYKADNSVVALVPTGDFSITPYPFNITDDIVSIRACGYIDQPPKIIKKGFLIKNDFLTADKRIQVPLTWNCVGHSIWAYDGVAISETNVYEGIQTLVKRIFKFEGYNKYCYSGFSLGATALDDANSLALRLNVFTDASVGFWTIDTITNDFKRNIPIGTISDYDNSTGVLTYYGALRAFRDRVVALQPNGYNSPVIAFNALKRNNSGYTSTSANTKGHTLLNYEAAIMTICALNGWDFVDQYRQSEITDETLMITTNDGLHPNNFGYKLVAKSVINAIWRLVKSLK